VIDEAHVPRARNLLELGRGGVGPLEGGLPELGEKDLRTMANCFGTYLRSFMARWAATGPAVDSAPVFPPLTRLKDGDASASIDLLLSSGEDAFVVLEDRVLFSISSDARAPERISPQVLANVGVVRFVDWLRHFLVEPSTRSADSGKPVRRWRLTVTTREEAEIAASLEDVWRVLADFDSYAAWHPYTDRIGGVAKAGETVTVYGSQPAIPDGHSYEVVITAAERPRELRFRERTFLPRAVNQAESGWLLDPVDAGRSLVARVSTTRSILTPLVYSSLTDTAGEKRELEALKTFVEGRASSMPTS
jgi:uncharacterized protein YndB with AHSA1/START domain